MILATEDACETMSPHVLVDAEKVRRRRLRKREPGAAATERRRYSERIAFFVNRSLGLLTIFLAACCNRFGFMGVVPGSPPRYQAPTPVDGGPNHVKHTGKNKTKEEKRSQNQEETKERRKEKIRGSNPRTRRGTNLRTRVVMFQMLLISSFGATSHQANGERQQIF